MGVVVHLVLRRPHQDSNLGTWFRTPLLYPLSYGGVDGLGLPLVGYHKCGDFSNMISSRENCDSLVLATAYHAQFIRRKQLGNLAVSTFYPQSYSSP